MSEARSSMWPRGYGAVLLRVGENEVRRMLRRAVMPYKLELFTTFACQSRCRTCNIWSRYVERPEQRAHELTPEQIERTVASARAHVRWISLTGGEVTERPDFVDIVRGIMAAVGDRLGLLNVVTNGLDPARTRGVFREVARVTRGVPLMVNVSLEPTGASYQAVRGIDGGRSAAIESLAALQEIARAERHLQSGYLITLSDLNAGIADQLEYVGTEGLGRMTVGVATDAELLTRGLAHVDAGLSSPALSRVIGRMWERYPVRGPLDLPPKLFLGLMRRFLQTRRAPLPCPAGEDVLTIDPHGTVLQCFHRATPLARLQDHDFDLRRVVTSAEFRDALAPGRSCRDCWQACEAYPSMFRHPARALAEYGKLLLAGRRRAGSAHDPV